MNQQIKDRTDLWLPLLHQLTEQFPRWAVLQNVNLAFVGTFDLDSLPPAADWQGIEQTRPIMICRHLPGGRRYVTFQEGSTYMIQLDVMAWRPFRGSAFDTHKLIQLPEMDEAGFRRIRPGAEGVLKFFLNGTCPRGRPNPDGLKQKNVLELLAANPEGVREVLDFHYLLFSQIISSLQRMGLGWAYRLALRPRRHRLRYIHLNPI
jgi:hypothetical protein